MSNGHFRKRTLSPSLGVAMLALLVALAGSATGAGLLVTSKQIKDGTIQMVDISKHARSQLKDGEAQGHGIEGTWRLTVTRVGLTPPTFTGFVTFAAGGSVVEVNPINQSTGVGVWTKLGDHRYRWVFTRFRFNPAGVAVATASAVETDTVGQDAETFEGTSTVEIRDLDGNVIGSGTATTRATRVHP